MLFRSRHCGITDECPTRGASNEIHICDSNMNGSYEREVILRRYADNETKTFSVTETRKEFSLLGRERSRLSKANYGYERGVENKYNTIPPLSRISNTHYRSQRTAPSTLGEGSVVTYESRVNPAYQKSKTLDNTS